MTWTDRIGRNWTPADGEPLAWLLTVTLGGTVYRWTSSPVELTDAGDLLPMDAEGLTFDYELPIADAPGTGSLAFEVFFPEGVSVAALVADGVALAGASAEVALVKDGAALEDRRVVLSGYVSQPIYGGPDEPVSFAVRPDDDATDAPLFSMSERVVPVGTTRKILDLIVLTVYDDLLPPAAQAFRVIPLVFGQPGRIKDHNGDVGYIPGSPAVCTTASTVSINSVNTTVADTIGLALGALPDTGVTLRAYTQDAALGALTLSTLVNAATEPTDISRSCAFVLADIAADFTSADKSIQSLDWYVAWASPAPALDGCPANPTMADVARYMMRRSTVLWDEGRSIGALAVLSAFVADGFIDEQTTPSEWMDSHLFSKYPVFAVHGPDGRYLVGVPFLSSTVGIGALVEGRGDVVRTGRVEVVKDGRSNRITVKWARSAVSGIYRRETTWAESQAAAETSVVWNEGAMERAARTDERVTVVEAPDCWDGSTAELLLAWERWRSARPVREVAVNVASERWGWLQVGDVVTYTDDALSLTSARAVVSRLTVSDGPWWPVRLMLID